MRMSREASKVNGRINAARNRVAKIATRKPVLGTDDPLLAEIQLAQLDALLAIAHGINHAIATIDGKIQISIDEKLYDEWQKNYTWEIDAQGRRIDKLKTEVEELMALVKSMHGTQIVETIKPSWWDRITGRK